MAQKFAQNLFEVEQAGLAVRFEVMSIPALLFFRDGVQTGRLDGLQSPDDILAAAKGS